MKTLIRQAPSGSIYPNDPSLESGEIQDAHPSETGAIGLMLRLVLNPVAGDVQQW